MKTQRLDGFSTLELLIAFAIGMLIVVAVVQVMFGAQYWLIASQTSSEGLYKAKTLLEDLRSAAKKDFQLASSTMIAPEYGDASCAAGGLCYFTKATIVDVSACAKIAHAHVEWKVQGYGTTTSDLYTSLTTPNEIIYLGGDCLVDVPEGEWNAPQRVNAGAVSGTPRAIDALDGIAYIGTSDGLYLKAGANDGVGILDGVNDIDVARDGATGRTYAFLATGGASNQFKVYEMTDPTDPVFVSEVTLGGALSGAFRVVVYSRIAYVTQLEGLGHELFVYNIAVPTAPVLLGSEELNTSIYDMVVRTQMVGGTMRTLLFAATSNTNRELRVWDVTDPSNVFSLAEADLPTSKPARSVYPSGNTIFVGLQSGSGADVFAVSATADELLSGVLSSFLSSGETSPRSIEAIRVSGGRAYLAGDSAGGRVFILNADDLTDEIGYEDMSASLAAGLDLDGDALYSVTPDGTVHMITSN